MKRQATETKNADDFEIKGEELEEFRTLLKTLCTKLPLSCQKKCYQKSFLDFQQLKPLNPEDLERLPIHKNIQIAESGKKLSCAGCVFSKVLDFICNGDMELFNVSKNWDLMGSFIAWHYNRVDENKYKTLTETYKEYTEEVQEELSKRERFFLFPKKNAFKEYYLNSLKNLFFKESTNEEVRDFYIAAYTVNPIVARFILPKKWAEIIEFYYFDKENYVKKLSAEEKQYLKEMCSQIHLDLTHSASGLIITENK